jgi:hypothetical protein
MEPAQQNFESLSGTSTIVSSNTTQVIEDTVEKTIQQVVDRNKDIEIEQLKSEVHELTAEICMLRNALFPFAYPTGGFFRTILNEREESRIRKEAREALLTTSSRAKIWLNALTSLNELFKLNSCRGFRNENSI